MDLCELVLVRAKRQDATVSMSDPLSDLVCRVHFDGEVNCQNIFGNLSILVNFFRDTSMVVRFKSPLYQKFD